MANPTAPETIRTSLVADFSRGAELSEAGSSAGSISGRGMMADNWLNRGWNSANCNITLARTSIRGPAGGIDIVGINRYYQEETSRILQCSRLRFAPTPHSIGTAQDISGLSNVFTAIGTAIPGGTK